MVDAWQASKTRMTVRHQAEAEATMASLPPPDGGARFEDPLRADALQDGG